MTVEEASRGLEKAWQVLFPKKTLVSSSHWEVLKSSFGCLDGQENAFFDVGSCSREALRKGFVSQIPEQVEAKESTSPWGLGLSEGLVP